MLAFLKSVLTSVAAINFKQSFWFNDKERASFSFRAYRLQNYMDKKKFSKKDFNSLKTTDLKTDNFDYDSFITWFDTCDNEFTVFTDFDYNKDSQFFTFTLLKPVLNVKTTYVITLKEKVYFYFEIKHTENGTYDIIEQKIIEETNMENKTPNGCKTS